MSYNGGKKFAKHDVLAESFSIFDDTGVDIKRISRSGSEIR